MTHEWIYGRRPVWEILRAGKRTLHKLWVAEGTSGGVVEDILRVARERGISVEWTRRERLDRMTGAHHQGMVAHVSSTVTQDLDNFLETLVPTAPAMLVALDEIQDPHNVGAILRNAGFFGVAAFLVPRWRSAPVGDTASRVSSGAIEYVPMIRVRNMVDALNRLKEAQFEVVGADVSGIPVWTYQRQPRVALVVGNEGKGLRRLVREQCDKLIGIPAKTPVGSLNVGSATAILLYEFFRPRSAPHQPT